MAFKSVGKVITTGGSPVTSDIVYTCPAASEAVVNSLFISNVDGTNSATVTIQFYDSSVATSFSLGTNLPIPAQSTLIFDKAINLEVGDELRMLASVNGDIEAVASIIEKAL